MKTYAAAGYLTYLGLSCSYNNIYIEGIIKFSDVTTTLDHLLKAVAYVTWDNK